MQFSISFFSKRSALMGGALALFLILFAPVLTQARSMGSPCDTCELSVDFGYTDSCLQVSFSDSSSVDTLCSIISRSWNFGDGSGGSTATHPVHTYSQAGVYIVCLTAKAAYGNDTCTVMHCDTLTLSIEALMTRFVSIRAICDR